MASNRLAREPSAYLRQHAGNPVEWYPWGPEALDRAKALDRPLFISIGYAACHWCHVMAHESFEDPAIAARLNAAFVPVKVDREERPDLDAVYMEAAQALTGSGGWPLSIFATPEGKPFYAGTYFPPRAGHNLPAFSTVLDAVATAWRERREELGEQADAVVDALEARRVPAGAQVASPPTGASLRAQAFARYRELSDPLHGGLKGAPKFPQGPLFDLVLRCAGTGVAEAGAMVETTLAAMASGGIYDHLEGGFCRYSVDGAWLVPHFEKMLYDQAQLARLYLHAWQATKDARWRQVVEETLAYACTRLRSPSGGFLCSEDADAGGVEGAFSTWTPAELDEALGARRGARAGAEYRVSAPGNFAEGRSVLSREPGAVLRDLELEEIRRDLIAARGRRTRPGIDDKVLTEWNAMMISCLAEAGLALGDPHALEVALDTADFLLEHLRDAKGRWRRSYAGGRAQHLALGADYAWLIDAFTRVFEATGEGRYLAEATRTASELIRLFSAEDGGWHSTGSDAEALVVRPRDTYDGVLPATGSVAAVALARLGGLSADRELLERAARTIEAETATLMRSPMALPHLVLAAELLDAGPLELVVTGARADLVTHFGRCFAPYVVLAFGEQRATPLFEGRPDGFAFLCRHGSCRAPISSADELEHALRVEQQAGQR